MSFEPNDHIADGLQVFAEMWEDDFVHFWGLASESPPDHLDYGTWRVHRILYDIAEGFLDAAATLQPGRLKIEALLEFFAEKGAEDPRDIGFVRRSTEVILSRDIGDTVASWRDRVLEIIDVVVSVRSERSRAYLIRLARCYMYGMQPEGAVMARAVLDTALEDLLDNDDILKAGNAKHPRRVDLDDRLTHVKRQRLISTEAWEAANRIRHAGNDAVHAAPGTAEDLRDTLERLKLVLEELDQM